MRNFAWLLTISLLVLLAAPALGQGCTGCARVDKTTDEKPIENPRFRGLAFNKKVVNVYLTPKTWAHESLPGQILGALTVWNGKACEDYRAGIPNFAFAADQDRIPADFQKQADVLVFGFAEGEPAILEGSGLKTAELDGNEVRIFDLCVNDKGAPINDPRLCRDGRVLWDTMNAFNVMTHEVGHSLGLGHDEGCSGTTLMSATFKTLDKMLEPSADHCKLASDLNDPQQACTMTPTQTGQSHFCELCRHSVGGTVTGLTMGESIKLTMTMDSGLPYYLTVSDEDAFTFNETVPEGFSYSVTVEGPASGNKTCTVTDGQGQVGTEDVTGVQVECVCVSGGEGCDEPERGSLFDLEPENQVVLATCRDYPILCTGTPSAFNPWWWAGSGPGTGDHPCQRETTCTSRVNCEVVDGKEICSEILDCHDSCVQTATVTLSGPRMLLEGLPEGGVLGGSVVFEGFVEDPDGLAGVDFFLDGAETAPADYSGGLYRPDACSEVHHDCNPMSGFTAEFDTSTWTPGAHRIDVVAIDGRTDYPMGTRIHRNFTVDNACSSTSPPTASIASPNSGAVLEGTATVTATATAAEGVEQVRFFLDGARVFTDFTSPYQWTWNTTTANDGPHALHVQVVDRCGGVDNSATVTVETANANVLPRMQLEVPTAGLTVAGSTVEVSGWAYDEDGVANVVLRVDGSPVLGATATGTRSRPEICSAEGEDDPDCPDVGWVVWFDSTRYPDGPHVLQLVVTDSRGGIVSSTRAVAISNQLPAPPGVNPPASRTIVEGDPVTLSVAVTSGAGPFTYWWQYRSGSRWLNLFEGDRGGRVTGAYTSQLAISGVGFADAGGYRCRVWNDGGVTESGSASLTVVESLDAPTVTAGIDQSVTEGETAELRVAAQGVGPLTFRWQHLQGFWVDVTNGSGITGATSATLRISGATEAHAGRYRCLVSNAGGTTPSADVRLTVHPDLNGSCVAGVDTICLHQNRFQAEVVINGSAGKAKPFSDLGGLFTLGNHANVEVAVKVLDGTAINGRHWLFHGSLTSLPYTLTVTDTVTGAVRVYQKSSGSFCGGADTAAFADPDPATGSFMVGSLLALPAASTTGSCQSSTSALCLLGSRFEVKVLRNGSAQRAVPVSSLSGAYTFGSSANPEVIVKVLDGTVVNDWYWVFFGSLTSQSYTVQVTDTATGAVKTYPSPGTSCGQADTSAF